MDYYSVSSVDELNAQFRNKTLSFRPGAITVEDIGKSFQLKAQSALNLNELFTDTKKSFVLIYESADLEHLVFGWKANGIAIDPVGVSYVTGLQEALKKSDNTNVIGTTLDVMISQLHQGQTIKAKIDTGASSCSIDAQDIQVANGYTGEETVTFVFRDKRYRARVGGYQQVRSADGGVQGRPTATFSVQANGQTYQGVEFNLNDRSGMEYDVLLGMNFLSKGDFLIDPQQEGLEITSEMMALYEITFDDEHPITEQAPEEVEQVISLLLKYPNIKLADIVKHMRLEAVAKLEQLQY